MIIVLFVIFICFMLPFDGILNNNNKKREFIRELKLSYKLKE